MTPAFEIAGWILIASMVGALGGLVMQMIGFARRSYRVMDAGIIAWLGFTVLAIGSLASMLGMVL